MQSTSIQIMKTSKSSYRLPLYEGHILAMEADILAHLEYCIDNKNPIILQRGIFARLQGLSEKIRISQYVFTYEHRLDKEFITSNPLLCKIFAENLAYCEANGLDIIYISTCEANEGIYYINTKRNGNGTLESFSYYDVEWTNKPNNQCCEYRVKNSIGNATCHVFSDYYQACRTHGSQPDFLAICSKLKVTETVRRLHKDIAGIVLDLKSSGTDLSFLFKNLAYLPMATAEDFDQYVCSDVPTIFYSEAVPHSLSRGLIHFSQQKQKTKLTSVFQCDGYFAIFNNGRCKTIPFDANKVIHFNRSDVEATPEGFSVLQMLNYDDSNTTFVQSVEEDLDKIKLAAQQSKRHSDALRDYWLYRKGVWIERPVIDILG